MLLIILIIVFILLFIKINYKYYEHFQNSSYTFIGNYYDQPIRAIPYLYPNTIIINHKFNKNSTIDEQNTAIINEAIEIASEYRSPFFGIQGFNLFLGIPNNNIKEQIDQATSYGTSDNTSTTGANWINSIYVKNKYLN